jgi:hypothetical protein
MSTDEDDDVFDRRATNATDRSSDGGAAMMSMFAAYYGIDEDAQNKSQAELIDTAHFDSRKYVEDMLSTMNIESLVSQDTTMVHEIRTLDSDMQMLVYENYNKFISATETIKRMKTNVEAMDGDMNTVKSKMEKIAVESAVLDESLRDKRTNIDKLVRVRRLLQKLEFLSELPEKLVELINNGQYKRAVQLYGRTITVLTRHSHMLSFQKIKERTELMMGDLRKKVMGLLDDSTLEAVKLTHYATILRMMEAPRGPVVVKLLAAHRSRTGIILREYAAAVDQAGVDSSLAVSEGTAIDEFLGSVSSGRKFHQTMVACLVEACKSINAVFEAIEPLAGLSKEEDEAGKSAVAKEEVSAFTNLHAVLMEISPGYTEKLLVSLIMFLSRYNAHMHYYQALEDALAASSQAAIAADMEANPDAYKDQPAPASNPPSRPSSMRGSTIGSKKLHNPFADVEDDENTNPFEDGNDASNPFDLSNNDGEGRESSGKADAQEVRASTASRGSMSSRPRELTTEEKSITQSLRAAQLKLYDFEEEKSAWYLLMKQVILDWEFLDRSFAKCYPSAETFACAGTNPVPPCPTFLPSVTAAVVHILDQQAQYVFDRNAIKMAGVLANSVSEAASLCNMHAEVDAAFDAAAETAARSNVGMDTSMRGSMHGNSSSHGGQYGGQYGGEANARGSAIHHGDPLSARYIIQRRTTEAKVVLDRMIDTFALNFASVCADAKAVIDMKEVTEPMKSSPENDLNPSADLMLKYCESTCHILAALCEVDKSLISAGLKQLLANHSAEDGLIVDNTVASNTPWRAPMSVSESSSAPAAVNAKDYENGCSENLTELWKGFVASTDKMAKCTPEGIQSLFSLLFSGFLRRLTPIIVNRLEKEVNAQELPPIENGNVLQSKCGECLEATAKVLLIDFVHQNAHYFSEVVSNAVVSKSLPVSDGGENACKVSDEVITIGVAIDSLVVSCCVLLAEPPPQLKVISGERNFGRQYNSALQMQKQAGSRASQTGIGLQMDIERLFSEKIQIFQQDDLIPSVDSIVGTVLKSVMKSLQEYMRMMTFPQAVYRDVQSDVTFLKQIGTIMLREPEECDKLSEQILMALFSRYLLANDISAASDSAEVSLVSRAANTALIAAGQRSVLLPRS